MNAGTTPSLYRLEGNLSLTQVIDELAAMPERLRKAIEGARSEALVRRPGPSDWSAFETIEHLRDATLVYAIRFRYVVFNDDPFLLDYDENNWVAASKDTVDDIPAIVDQIASSRADLVRVLSRLPDQAWRRGGRHETIGPLVLEDYARHQVVHEEMHMAQITAALAASRS